LFQDQGLLLAKLFKTLSVICVPQRTSKYGIALFILFSSSISANDHAASARPEIVFACEGLLPKTHEYFQNVFEQTFSRMGFNFRIAPVTLKRALLESDKGKIDGLCGRIVELAGMKTAENLHRVNVPVLNIQLSLWKYGKKYSSDSIEHIKQNGDLVGYPIGSLISKHFVDKNQLQTVIRTPSASHGLEMLKMDRIQYLVSGQDFFEGNTQCIACFELSKINFLDPVQLYPYLHKRWNSIELEFETVLKEVLNEITPHRENTKEMSDYNSFATPL
jgi:hypothetical protein